MRHAPGGDASPVPVVNMRLGAARDGASKRIVRARQLVLLTDAHCGKARQRRSIAVAVQPAGENAVDDAVQLVVGHRKVLLEIPRGHDAFSASRQPCRVAAAKTLVDREVVTPNDGPTYCITSVAIDETVKRVNRLSSLGGHESLVPPACSQIGRASCRERV